MIDYAIFEKLEKSATKLREFLKIPSEQILNYEYLDELVTKINSNFSDVVIEDGYDKALTITNENEAIIICPLSDEKIKPEEKFDFILHAFCYFITFDKTKLQFSRDQKINIHWYKVISDEKASTLARAIMIPREAFFRELAIHSRNDGSVKTKEMQLKFKNNHIIARGSDLRVGD